MRLLVTGGAGFIGSNFVHRALGQGDEVTVYDALTYAGNMSNLAGLDDAYGSAAYRFVEGDVCDGDLLAATMAGHDAVVHFAAESHVDRSITDPARFVVTNCQGTATVCEVALRLEVDRLLHVSTDEVYGSIDVGSFVETDALSPNSPYAASKASSDLIALAYHATFDLPVVVTRSTNNYGRFQFPEKVIPLFVTRLLAGGNVPLYGDGGNVRDWCHVDDNCDAIDLALRSGVSGGVYNVGAGNEMTNLDLTGRLLSLCGADESSIDYVEDRLGHDRRYSVDTARIEALGWFPRRGLDEGLAETVAWYRDNPGWWDRGA
ncbi:MAG: dTDP-glucose 4,6-dehydratase [Actinobacteria bacterium]|nr:dTDP-glucose 4,6-dehydratase [Actinomycetota bacterium]MBT3686700.1 dTDP-glucose 4,6-dehydratase [Actinomycetota bacterium]MBT4038374.1 dTDP-glucose 4,6-dehydratase [Actinomycetota bacterium]MBT4279676.1 dTDP-glucose 4,6-dehydratase [Actinomycetota bacterium]MBT6064141.1 dTDP-glucose 4,6-dehydratase [Actinomycetota bacterium]